MRGRDVFIFIALIGLSLCAHIAAGDEPQRMTTTTRAPEPAEPPTGPSTVSTSEPSVATTLPVPPTTRPADLDDRFWYSIGYDFGRAVRERFAPEGRAADIGTLLKGVIDGVSGHDPALPRAQIESALAQAQDRTLQQRAEQMYASDPAFRKIADDNLARSKALLQQNGSVAGVESLPEGVQVQVLKPGAGRVIGNAKFVIAHVEVCLVDGTLVHASEPGKPERVAIDQALPALLDAVRGMKVGARWRIVLPPEKAYGLAGKPPVIGPNQALRYEIELVEVE